MTTAIRNWVQTYRYKETMRQLQALSSGELQVLGITPSQIEYLAVQVSRATLRP